LIKKAATDVWIKAEVDSSLEPGDSIKTSEDSTALILFFEGSTIELNPETEIRISELGINNETKSTTIELWQEIGKTRSRVEKLVDPASKYQINTKLAAAVVRGSIAEVTVFPSGYTTILNVEGNWYVLVKGQLLVIPEGYTFVILTGGDYYFTAYSDTGPGSSGGSRGGRGAGGGGKRP